MSDILKRIVAVKHEEIAEAKRSRDAGLDAPRGAGPAAGA